MRLILRWVYDAKEGYSGEVICFEDANDILRVSRHSVGARSTV
jgi:hypothetical protein